MSLYKQFATDQSKEVSGIILTYGKNSKGDNIDIRIARAGGANTKFAKVAEAVMRPYRRQIANENIDIEVVEGLLRMVYARAVVLDWSGVEDKDGNDLPFTEENVVQLFTDLPDLFKDIRDMAEKLSVFRNSALEDEAKN